MADWFYGLILYWQLHSVSNGKGSLGCNCNHLDESDTTLVHELLRQVAQLKQGRGSLEKYYNDLQGLWWEIDFHHPNPMQCPEDIKHFNNTIQEDQVYTFLDNIRRYMLQLKLFPTVE